MFAFVVAFNWLREYAGIRRVKSFQPIIRKYRINNFYNIVHGIADLKKNIFEIGYFSFRSCFRSIVPFGSILDLGVEQYNAHALYTVEESWSWAKEVGLAWPNVRDWSSYTGPSTGLIFYSDLHQKKKKLQKIICVQI